MRTESSPDGTGRREPGELIDWLELDGRAAAICEEYNQYWRTVVETMMDGLLVVDPQGTIVSVNPALSSLSGYDPQELIGRSCSELKFDTCEKARQKGGLHHCELFKDGRVRRCRCSLRRKDGKVIPVLKNAAVLHDGRGQVIGGVETLTDLSEVAARDKVISSLKRELKARDGFQGLIGRSPAMVRLFDLIRSAATSPAPVVIFGQSGTGKELVAQAVHNLGPRSKGPFIKVNCAALNESLLESELFGHVKGAFTGADKNRVGRFEAASGGDIFLDEIGDLPPSTQVKLLRVLQENEIERVGDHRPIRIDVRVITATNQDLSQLMSGGAFREDLYYRIAAIPIRLPSLAERPEDIPLLAETFITRMALAADKEITGLSREALEVLTGYDWPGNVRELINALEYAMVLCPGGLITPAHLPVSVVPRGPGLDPVQGRGTGGRFTDPQGERRRILAALRETKGNKTEAAKRLGISRVTLWKRLKSLEIEVEKLVRG